MGQSERATPPTVTPVTLVDAPSAVHALVPEVGTQIGRYVVLEHVGDGGMGRVMRAYDSKLRREVALKLLHEIHDATAHARLVREAQAMARLSHPNIVSVFDVDIHHARPFIVMEFVVGRTIKAWLREAPRSTEAVLDAFIAVARGLAAAHGAGLIHRDVKLGNLLYGDDGRVRVTDFGIARNLGEGPSSCDDLDVVAYGEVELTLAGTVVGTPTYMAPEQHAGGNADARSDQYGFCVSLWEALVGVRPFEGDDADALLAAKAAMRLEPLPTGCTLPGYVRSALLRGLSPLPEQRHATMQDLLAQLSRGHVRARWRRAAVAGAAVLATGGVVLGIAAWDHQRRIAACEREGAAIEGAWNDDARAHLRAGLLASGVDYAGVTADKVMPWLDAHASAWQHATTAACVDAEVDRTIDDDMRARASWCLDDRRMGFEALLDELALGGVTAVEHAVLGAASLPPIDGCRDYDALARLPPPPRERPDEVGEVRRELSVASARIVAGEYPSGLALSRAALEHAEALEWPPLVAAARHRLGRALEKTGAFEEAEHVLEEAYFTAREAGAADVEVDAAESLAFTVALRRGRHVDGMRWSRHAELLLASVSDPASHRRIRHLNTLMMIHHRNGEYERAVPLGEQALALAEQSFGTDSLEIAPSLDNLATVYSASGEYQQAERTYRRTLTLRERALGGEHPDVARTLSNLAHLREITHDLPAAQEELERALRIRERALGPLHHDVAATLHNLANVHASAGDAERALALYERALAIHEANGEQEAGLFADLGLTQAALGDREAARTLLGRAVAIREAELGPNHPDLARTLNSLGLIELETGDVEAARRALERALAIQQAALAGDHPELAATLVNLGRLETTAGALDHADELFGRALAIRERALGPEHPKLAFPLAGLAEVALARGRPEAAVPLAERAIALHERAAPGSLDLADARFLLARALPDRERERARALALEALASYRNDHGLRAAALADVERWLARRR